MEDWIHSPKKPRQFSTQYRSLRKWQGHTHIRQEDTEACESTEVFTVVFTVSVCFFSKDLYNHSQKCSLRSDAVTDQKQVKSQSRFFLHGAIKADESVPPKFKCDILNNMHHDSISRICRTDNTIMTFGLSLYQKLARLRSHNISQRMWQLARQLQAVNSTECLTGRMFDSTVLATLYLCGSYEDPSGRSFLDNPSLGLKLGHNLVKCAEVK